MFLLILDIPTYKGFPLVVTFVSDLFLIMNPHTSSDERWLGTGGHEVHPYDPDRPSRSLRSRVSYPSYGLLNHTRDTGSRSGL